MPTGRRCRTPHRHRGKRRAAGRGHSRCRSGGGRMPTGRRCRTPHRHRGKRRAAGRGRSRCRSGGGRMPTGRRCRTPHRHRGKRRAAGRGRSRCRSGGGRMPTVHRSRKLRHRLGRLRASRKHRTPPGGKRRPTRPRGTWPLRRLGTPPACPTCGRSTRPGHRCRCSRWAPSRRLRAKRRARTRWRGGRRLRRRSSCRADTGSARLSQIIFRRPCRMRPRPEPAGLGAPPPAGSGCPRARR